MNMREWIVHVQEQQGNIPKSASRRKNDRRVFYRVPSDVREGQDPSVFNPSKISIGPYHHSNPSLQSGQRHKEQCLPHFLNREIDNELPQYVNALRPMVDELRDEYDQLDPVWLDENKKDDLLKMMVVDGSYLLEIMLQAIEGEFILFDPNEMDTYKHDMLLFENQISIKVLAALVSVQHPSFRKVDIQKWLGNLIADFFSLEGDFQWVFQKPVHLLDCYQRNIWTVELSRRRRMMESLCNPRLKTLIVAEIKRILSCCSSRKVKKEESGKPLDFYIPSATGLLEAQIAITTNETSNLMDISFTHSTLMLPKLNVGNITKSMFHNLIMAERFLSRKDLTFVTSYVCFMNGLLKGAADSSVLQSHGIITTALQDDEVVKLFNGLRQTIALSPNNLMDADILEVGERLRERYNRNMEPWRKDLLQRYLKSPWAIISIMVAVLIFISTMTQTIYTVLGYYKSNK